MSGNNFQITKNDIVPFMVLDTSGNFGFYGTATATDFITNSGASLNSVYNFEKNIRTYTVQKNFTLASTATGTLTVTRKDLGLPSSSKILSVTVHKQSPTIYQFFDYSYDLVWNGNTVVVIYGYNGHTTSAIQNFEINILAVG